MQNPYNYALAAVFLALSMFATANTKAIPCAAEGQACAQQGSTIHATRYGKDTHFSLFTQNVNLVHCSHTAFGGDPKYGAHKSCTWSEVQNLPNYGWNKCADGDVGQRCNIGNNRPGEILMVRYGTPNGDRWLYSYVAEDFDCRLNGFGYDVDVAPGEQKQCQLASQVEPYVGTWVTCATGEGRSCNFSDDGPRLVRYGDAPSKRFWYKTVIGKDISCSLATFMWDPAPNLHKTCEFLEVPFGQRLVKVQGSWEKVLKCQGCTSTQYEVSTGVTTGKETVKSKEWGTSLTTTLETSVGGNSGVASSETKIGFSASVSNSFARSVGSSFTKEASATKTVSCDKGAIYQFVTSVDEHCAAGICTTMANSDEFACQTPSEPPPS